MTGVTIAIPTFNRGTILVETIRQLLALEVPADEIVVVDQTPVQPPEVAAALAQWDADGSIRWIRLPKPSIPSSTRSIRSRYRARL